MNKSYTIVSNCLTRLGNKMNVGKCWWIIKETMSLISGNRQSISAVCRIYTTKHDFIFIKLQIKLYTSLYTSAEKIPSRTRPANCLNGSIRVNPFSSTAGDGSTRRGKNLSRVDKTRRSRSTLLQLTDRGHRGPLGEGLALRPPFLGPTTTHRWPSRTRATRRQRTRRSMRSPRAKNKVCPSPSSSTGERKRRVYFEGLFFGRPPGLYKPSLLIHLLSRSREQRFAFEFSYCSVLCASGIFSGPFCCVWKCTIRWVLIEVTPLPYLYIAELYD